MKKMTDWIKNNKQDALVALAIVALVLVALAMTVPQVLLVAAGVGLLVWASYTPPAPPVIDHGVDQCVLMVFKILKKFANDLGVVCMERPEGLAFWTMLTEKGGLEIIRMTIQKRPGQALLTPEQFKEHLQCRIEEMLVEGKVERIPFISRDCRHPIFAVLDVEEPSGFGFDVDIAYLDTPEKIAAYDTIQKNRLLLGRAKVCAAPGEPDDGEF